MHAMLTAIFEFVRQENKGRNGVTVIFAIIGNPQAWILLYDRRCPFFASHENHRFL
jgi:hypothetical protein